MRSPGRGGGFSFVPRRSEGSALPPRRETALPLRDLQQVLQAAGPGGRPQGDPQRGQALQVQALREGLRPPQRVQEPQEGNAAAARVPEALPRFPIVSP